MTDAILYWNQIALDVEKEDFNSIDAATNPMPYQGGPTRTSRALAMVHIAMYDAYTSVSGAATYLTYSAGEKPALHTVPAAQAAVGTAASLMLLTLFTRQKTKILEQNTKFMATLAAHDPDVADGFAWGTVVAEKMLSNRKGDGSDPMENFTDNFYVPSDQPGRHRPDPQTSAQIFLGPLWGKVKPFGIKNLNLQVPGLPPPPLNSAPYATDFKDVVEKGSRQGGTRTPDETTIGIFWAYDGVRNIGVPPRLYNQAVREISLKKCATEAENAKLFAMVNIAMADAGIQAWDEKYRHNVWRPVLGIREADAGWGPTGAGDRNAATKGDPYWVPLGAPATNQPAKGAGTPPFPAYPSGHATFGTAALRVAALALGLPDTFEFELVSDELDGISVGAAGVRARNKRKLSIKQAIAENARSRVFLGVHWQFDCTEGEKNGELIAQKIATAFPAMA